MKAERSPTGRQPGEAPDREPLEGKNPIMNDFSLRAARIQLGALLAALALAIVIALGITRGSGSRLTKSGAKGQSPSDLAL